MLACFLKNNKDVFKEFKKHVAASEAKADSDDDQKSASSKNGKLVGKKRTKRSPSSSSDEANESESDSSSEDSETEKKGSKKNGKTNGKTEPPTKRRRTSSVSSSRSRSKSEEKTVKKAKIVFTRRKKSDVEYEPYVAPKNQPQVTQQSFVKFSRINDDKFKSHLVGTGGDHSFESKARFGEEGDKFGEWSYSKLKDTVGKGFKKEKGKMKNRQFHSAGQAIGYGVNSVKF